MAYLAQRPPYLIFLSNVRTGRIAHSGDGWKCISCYGCQPRALPLAPCARKEERFSMEAQCFTSLFLLNEGYGPLPTLTSALCSSGWLPRDSRVEVVGGTPDPGWRPHTHDLEKALQIIPILYPHRNHWQKGSKRESKRIITWKIGEKFFWGI